MSNKVAIKVCGMRDPDNILRVAELQPDYMGFIFYPKSKRFVGGDFSIPEKLPKSIKRVGVFVNETTNRIVELTTRHQLDFIQLHGAESVGQCEDLKAKKIGVIKVFSIDHHFDLIELDPYKKAVDYFLFDKKSEAYGGSGRVFEWSLLNKYKLKTPFFLSGGLSATNIVAAKKEVVANLHAFDLNSGIEISPGIKSIERLQELKQLLIS